MGLDNGIVLNKPTSVIPFYVKVDSWASSQDSVEICYWRKCWGIRDEILSLFPEADSNDSCLKLTPEHIRAIRKIIRSFIIQHSGKYDNGWGIILHCKKHET